MKYALPKDKRLLKSESAFWRHSANALAVIVFGLALLDWKTGGGLGLILFYACLVYIAALAVYCGEKEYERWSGYHRGEGTGAGYVFAWTLLMAYLFFFGAKGSAGYFIPPELAAAYIVVVAFFAITEKSKSMHAVQIEKRKAD